MSKTIYTVIFRLCSRENYDSLTTISSRYRLAHYVRSMFTFDSLYAILSYSGVERGVDLQLRQVSRLFNALSERYVERYREIVKHYTAPDAFITLEEFERVKDLYPNLRFQVSDTKDEWRLRKTFNGRVYRYKEIIEGEKFYILYTYDEEGKVHSYNDKPAVISYTPVCYLKEWRWHGELHRKHDRPARIGISYLHGVQLCKDYNTFIVWYRNGKIDREGGKPDVILPLERKYLQDSDYHLIAITRTRYEVFEQVYNEERVPEDSIMNLPLKSFRMSPCTCKTECNMRIECTRCGYWIHDTNFNINYTLRIFSSTFVNNHDKFCKNCNYSFQYVY